MEFEYPINLSLIRRNLFGGIELIPLAVIVVPLFAIGLLLLSYGGYTYGLLMWLACGLAYFGFRHTAKVDPYMFSVYLRAWRYKRLYAPRPTIHKKYRGVMSPQKMTLIASVAALGVIGIMLLVMIIVMFGGW